MLGGGGHGGSDMVRVTRVICDVVMVWCRRCGDGGEGGVGGSVVDVRRWGGRGEDVVLAAVDGDEWLWRRCGGRKWSESGRIMGDGVDIFEGKGKIYLFVCENMEAVSSPMVAAAKLPVLNPGEFEVWKMRIE
ncbi:hypothetical protein Tco_0252694 [Tanacetum coccineum]